MATPKEKLATSLEALRALQERGVVAIRARDLSRVHRERLLRNGLLQEVMKGWYVAARQDEAAGESTAWYTSFWPFCAAYLRERFGDECCLSPEQSLSLHAGNRAVPRQLLVRSPKAGNKVLELPYGTSLLDVRATMPGAEDVAEIDGLRLFKLSAALVDCGPRFFSQSPTDVRTALSMVRDASQVLDRLLEGGHSKIAGRLAGAFRNIGQARIADNILETMRAAGYDVRETDPFETPSPMLLTSRENSPYVNRLRLMWKQFRDPVLEEFPAPPGRPRDSEVYLKQVEEQYVSDAYHSLSIEGYRVSAELIERVRGGNWDPDARDRDREHRDALAARGYWQAHQLVLKSVRRVLQGKNPGDVADDDHAAWYRELFAPSVKAGLATPADLAGYRNAQVYIRRSMHVPPTPDAVRELMPCFFDLLREEAEPPVRVVLGHFAFVYIHPYMDGNGRMGRFLMNVLLAAGGYPWTVIPVDHRNEYLDALEAASVNEDIAALTRFLANLLEQGLVNPPAAPVRTS